jgi:transcription initiation factor TFIID subunit 7
MESHKTIDSKTFYKTVDICQRLICKEGEDLDDEEDASSPVKKKKDPNKEDKKYLYPHGIEKEDYEDIEEEVCGSPEIEKEVGILILKDLRVHFGSSGEEALES